VLCAGTAALLWRIHSIHDLDSILCLLGGKVPCDIFQNGCRAALTIPEEMGRGQMRCSSQPRPTCMHLAKRKISSERCPNFSPILEMCRRIHRGRLRNRQARVRGGRVIGGRLDWSRAARGR
jgi:hypothetical protein